MADNPPPARINMQEFPSALHFARYAISCRMVAIAVPFSKVVISHHLSPHPITPIVGTTVRGVLYAVISAPMLRPQEVTAAAVVAAFASGLVGVGSAGAVCACAAMG